MDTCSTGVVKTDNGCANLHGLVHHLADFQRHCLAQRTGKHREILCKDIHQTSVDGAVAGNHSVAHVRLFQHVEIGATVLHKHVEFFKRAFVEQKRNALAGSKFALLVLLVDTLLTAAHFGFNPLVEELFYFFFNCHFM